MQTAAIICATLLFGINQAGDSPEYDYSYSGPTGNQYNECHFPGSISNTGSGLCTTRTINRKDFYQGGDLTWEILTSVCTDLVRAGCADPDWEQGEEHNMTRDLVWDKEGIDWTVPTLTSNCGRCPRCKCNNGTEPSYYERDYTSFTTTTAFQTKICYECTCDYFYSEREDDGNYTAVFGRTCRGGNGILSEDNNATLNTWNSPSEFMEPIECPEEIYPLPDLTTGSPTPAPTGPTANCSDSDTGLNPNYYEPGQYFFLDDGNNCDTYCYCNDDAERECEQGWDAILNARGDEMKYSFLDSCAFRLYDAWDDTSRYWKANNSCRFSFTSGNNNCPYGLCADGVKPGDDAYRAIEYSGRDYNDDFTAQFEEYDCATCYCYDANGWPNFIDQNLTTCNTPNQYNQEDTAACTDEYLNCTTNWEAQAFSTYPSYYYYCGWTEMQVPDTFDPDTVCVESSYESGPSWGTQDRYLCEAWYGYEDLAESETGYCSVTDISFRVEKYDCIDKKWKGETQKVTISNMCCGSSPEGTPACNNQEPGKLALGDDNKCSSNSKIKDYYQTLYACQASNRGVSDEYMRQTYCGTALDAVDFDDSDAISNQVCDLIEQRW
eukprot:CAMPEP_0201565880 /NCGR_PEP_ID=MMETSP0190_2-20130828/5300_1 /ASSEMBLY_ACC=CAM_ASM_000263 /TAXON_ID=37353 /ORGANISM="Rosalina sp." /LENGTH=606 /DNA_ID=CAMNT_0047983877 /DNA_START=42 /DNA_END=1859 /DNA_ORIENTATION=-